MDDHTQRGSPARHAAAHDTKEPSMADEPTCGQGLARHAELPRLMGHVMNAVADNLSAHLSALVSGDELVQDERRVYERLTATHRTAAEMLQAIGGEMARCNELPMGEHDIQAMSPAHVTDALEAMVRAEARLATRLQDQLTEHQAMLDSMRS
jgi:hypothetical protein